MIEEENIFTLSPAINSEEAGAQSEDQFAEDVVVRLYSKMRPQLVSYVYSVIGTTNDAEDIVQNAFLKLFDHLVRKAEILNLRSWLYKVVHNLAVNCALQKTTRDSLSQEWVSSCAASQRLQSAESDLMQREIIDDAMQRLSDTERKCLMLRAEGLSYNEISSVLGISAKSVSVYLVRGAKKFGSKNGNHR